MLERITKWGNLVVVLSTIIGSLFMFTSGTMGNINAVPKISRKVNRMQRQMRFLIMAAEIQTHKKFLMLPDDEDGDEYAR